MILVGRQLLHVDSVVAGDVDHLQSRDPFSGDCDSPLLRAMGTITSTASALQSRDPFSGDCDSFSQSGCFSERIHACRAETRSQGIATLTF